MKPTWHGNCLRECIIFAMENGRDPRRKSNGSQESLDSDRSDTSSLDGSVGSRKGKRRGARQKKKRRLLTDGSDDSRDSPHPPNKDQTPPPPPPRDSTPPPPPGSPDDSRDSPPLPPRNAYPKPQPFTIPRASKNKGRWLRNFFLHLIAFRVKIEACYAPRSHVKVQRSMSCLYDWSTS